MKQFAVRNLRLCTKDCLCLYVCPVGATDTENSVIDRQKCTGCGLCALACPSGAISMVPQTYPPQQPKENTVLSTAHALAHSKAEEESMARKLAAESSEDALYRLLAAAEKSLRLVHEDLSRESGYMLPQSKNAKEKLQEWIQNPPTQDFPKEAAETLLEKIPCNEE